MFLQCSRHRSYAHFTRWQSLKDDDHVPNSVMSSIGTNRSHTLQNVSDTTTTSWHRISKTTTATQLPSSAVRSMGCSLLQASIHKLASLQIGHSLEPNVSVLQPPPCWTRLQSYTTASTRHTTWPWCWPDQGLTPTDSVRWTSLYWTLDTTTFFGDLRQMKCSWQKRFG